MVCASLTHTHSLPAVGEAKSGNEHFQANSFSLNSKLLAPPLTAWPEQWPPGTGGGGRGGGLVSGGRRRGGGGIEPGGPR